MTTKELDAVRRALLFFHDHVGSLSPEVYRQGYCHDINEDIETVDNLLAFDGHPTWSLGQPADRE